MLCYHYFVIVSQISVYVIVAFLFLTFFKDKTNEMNEYTFITCGLTSKCNSLEVDEGLQQEENSIFTWFLLDKSVDACLSLCENVYIFFEKLFYAFVTLFRGLCYCTTVSKTVNTHQCVQFNE